MEMRARKREAKLDSGRTLRRPGGALPALVAATLRVPALTRLAPRELEVATIVYLNTGITAREVEAALSSPITNAAIRSMLNRLVDKGILRRRRGEGKFYYSPALLLPSIQERALERVVDDYFAGSLSDAFVRLVGLVRATRPDILASLTAQAGLPARTPQGGSLLLG